MRRIRLPSRKPQRLPRADDHRHADRAMDAAGHRGQRVNLGAHRHVARQQHDRDDPPEPRARCVAAAPCPASWASFAAAKAALRAAALVSARLIAAPSPPDPERQRNQPHPSPWSQTPPRQAPGQRPPVPAPPGSPSPPSRRDQQVDHHRRRDHHAQVRARRTRSPPTIPITTAKITPLTSPTAASRRITRQTFGAGQVLGGDRAHRHGQALGSGIAAHRGHDRHQHRQRHNLVIVPRTARSPSRPGSPSPG